ncbi:unnamed protein product [Lactuca saligna]|uniref:F-box associated beta-propeller type 3 domain-containing protein n=1 Tax=Lactuca saligna TaxID=75948 RepID=A0AA35YEW5_LACSI|nr:unnamed protein product [Lactuca saligna]
MAASINVDGAEENRGNAKKMEDSLREKIGLSFDKKSHFLLISPRNQLYLELKCCLQEYLMESALTESRKESEYEETKTKGKVGGFDLLPDDLLLDILKRLPDNVLRYHSKKVCTQWFDIITNNILLDHASFIIQRPIGCYPSRHVEIRVEGEGIEVKEHSLDMHSIGPIKSWCDEFILIVGPYGEKSIIAFNIVNKVGSILPPCHAPCRGHSENKCAVVLTFDAIKGIYKVLHVYMGPPIQCHVLVLGKDVVSGLSSSYWKRMELPPKMEIWQDYKGEPVCVQARYLHWELSSDYMVSMDTVKEKTVLMSVPQSHHGTAGNHYTLFEMGGFLCLITRVSWAKAAKTDIWRLTDFDKMIWQKFQSITIPRWYLDKGYTAASLYPICGVVGNRFVIFKSSSILPTHRRRSIAAGPSPLHTLPLAQLYSPLEVKQVLHTRMIRLVNRLSDSTSFSRSAVHRRRSIVLHTLPLTHICSPLEVKQVNGLWKTKTQNMTSLCKVAKELKDKFASFQICHVEREFNIEADRCSSEPGSTSPAPKGGYEVELFGTRANINGSISPKSRCAMGNCFSMQKDHETALKNFQRAVQLNSRIAYTYQKVH